MTLALSTTTFWISCIFLIVLSTVPLPELALSLAFLAASDAAMDLEYASWTEADISFIAFAVSSTWAAWLCAPLDICCIADDTCSVEAFISSAEEASSCDVDETMPTELLTSTSSAVRLSPILSSDAANLEKSPWVSISTLAVRSPPA